MGTVRTQTNGSILQKKSARFACRVYPARALSTHRASSSTNLLQSLAARRPGGSVWPGGGRSGPHRRPAMLAARVSGRRCATSRGAPIPPTPFSDTAIGKCCHRGAARPRPRQYSAGEADGDVGGHVMGVRPQPGSVGPRGDIATDAGIMPCGAAFYSRPWRSLRCRTQVSATTHILLVWRHTPFACLHARLLPCRTDSLLGTHRFLQGR